MTISIELSQLTTVAHHHALRVAVAYSLTVSLRTIGYNGLTSPDKLIERLNRRSDFCGAYCATSPWRGKLSLFCNNQTWLPAKYVANMFIANATYGGCKGYQLSTCTPSSKQCR